MHIFFTLRGPLNETRRFLEELNSRYLPFKMQPQDNEKGPLQPLMLQTVVRYLPLGCYDLAFPSENLDIVLNSLFGNPEDKNNIIPRSLKTFTQKLGVKFLREMLDADPLPETWATDKFIPLFHVGVEIIGIGIKEDNWVKDGKEVPKGTEGAWEAI